MSQENVEIVRASYEAWNARDMDGVRDRLHPDTIMRSSMVSLNQVPS